MVGELPEGQGNDGDSGVRYGIGIYDIVCGGCKGDLSPVQANGRRRDGQLADEQLTTALDPEMNCIAQIVKHMAGNMRSRWTGFPEADGEKPDRCRDTEFEAPPATRAELMTLWNAGWDCMFAALAPLTDADVARETFIRGERHSVVQAINRQLVH